MYYKDNIFGIATKIEGLELEIVKSREIQRLKGIHSSGARYIVSPVKHSRFEHSMGLFSLMHYFNRTREERVAALVHDVGHLPFSHSLEDLFDSKKGIHHDLNKKIIIYGKLSALMKKYGVDAEEIYKIVEGIKESPIRTRKSISADHLDNHIRDTIYLGVNKYTPSKILSETRIVNNNINETLLAGRALCYRIYKNNTRLFNSIIGYSMVLRHLIVLEKELFDVDKLMNMNDKDVLKKLANARNDKVRRIAREYFLETNKRIHAFRSDEKQGKDNMLVSFDNKYYAAYPLVDGKPIVDVDQESRKYIDACKTMGGYFYVDIDKL